jgi:hypothetical protein
VDQALAREPQSLVDRSVNLHWLRKKPLQAVRDDEPSRPVIW